MAFVISQTFDCAAYYLGTLVLNLHKGIGRTLNINIINFSGEPKNAATSSKDYHAI